MGRMERISQLVQGHDPLLYCGRSKDGKLCVYRKSTRVESYEIDGDVIQFVRPTPHFVFALTDNWQLAGHPVEWGAEPILARLKAMDLWNRDLAGECIKETEKRAESTQRAARNNVEGFLSEFRSQFARTFNDVNTANMDKTDNRKKGEKNGYC